jgi:arsenate reductase
VTLLGRRALAEFVGTGLLVAAVIGSGIAASRLSPGDTGLQLLENSLATGAALAALILALRPVSASFNPVVTLVELALGGLRAGAAAALGGAQLAGGLCGAVVANLMFELDAVSIATHQRDSHGALVAEVVATLGLVLVVFGTVQSRHDHHVAYAVGGYIAAAYWFTSSTSFANPAVTVARMFSDTFAGIAPGSVVPFVLAQLAGGGVGYLLVRALYPKERRLVVPRRPSVLFLCVHNAGRSQMAQGWLRQLAGDRIEVRSAGSLPAREINPVAVAVMAEVGIDITAETPKALSEDTIEASDVVVSMGCGDACPILPGKRYENWELDDPAGQDLDTVRTIRDRIRTHVEALAASLTPHTTTGG